MRHLLSIVALLLWGCGSSEQPDAGAADLALDRASDEASPDAGPDTLGDSAPADALPAADLGPNASLVIEQIKMESLMGEGGLVIGPDGTSVLIDSGGDVHAGAVLEAVERRTGKRAVDWLVITHYHADHTGGFDKLVKPSAANANNPLLVTRGLVSRGLYDLDGGFIDSDADFRQYCEEVKGAQWDGRRFDLCEGPQQIACGGSGAGDPWPAASCDGLLRGDLLDKGDDGQGRLSSISLGGGARLYLFHANGRVATKDGVESAAAAGVQLGHGGTGPENGRSVGGVIRWGSFSYAFNGDLPGGGLFPDLESFIAARADKIVEHAAGPPLVQPGALDVAKLSHHGFASSTNVVWIDWLFPADGKSRNAVIGASQGYVLPPEAPLLERLAPRLGGGYAWITAPGLLGAQHAKLRVAGGAVVVEVGAGGAEYEVSTLAGGAKQQAEKYTATVP